MTTKPKLTKEAANYREASDPKRCCGTCAMYEKRGACSLVRGAIRSEDVCRYWESAHGKA